MAQRWDDLLFAHWRYPAELLRPLVPANLSLDLWEESGWVSVVPFIMHGVRARGTPPLPWISAFPELNVRTYVVADGKPGVWFFSLDAANPLAVRAARRGFHLPYFDARMRSARDGSTVRYRSERTHHGAPPAAFVATYRPTGYPALAQPETLDYFLAERYCLYALLPDGRPARSEIHHAPWLLQPAAAEPRVNTMLAAAGLPEPSEPPRVQFAASQDVIVWRPRAVDADGWDYR